MPPRRELLVLVLVLQGAAALEPVSLGIAIGAASALTGYLSYPRFYCGFVECCPRDGDRPNATGTGAGQPGGGGAAWDLPRGEGRW